CSLGALGYFFSGLDTVVTPRDRPAECADDTSEGSSVVRQRVCKRRPVGREPLRPAELSPRHGVGEANILLLPLALIPGPTNTADDELRHDVAAQAPRLPADLPGAKGFEVMAAVRIVPPGVRRVETDHACKFGRLRVEFAVDEAVVPLLRTTAPRLISE